MTLTPDTTVITKVETYRSRSWWEVIASFIKEKRTGSLELHLSQGAVAVVQWREKQ